MAERHLALVTGASAGIGAALARVYAQEGYDLALTARRADRLDALADELRRDHGVDAFTIAADLKDPGAPQAIVDAVAARGRHVDALINNAGYSVSGNWADTSWADQAAFLQVMNTACLALCHLTWPGMIERNFGRVMNVSSLAGIVAGGSGGALYGATKALLIRFSESLHAEAREAGADNVHILALCPGFTHTEFHEVNGIAELRTNVPGFMWQDADVVAREAFQVLDKGASPRLVPGAPNKLVSWLNRALPYTWMLAVSNRARARMGGD